MIVAAVVEGEDPRSPPYDDDSNWSYSLHGSSWADEDDDDDELEKIDGDVCILKEALFRAKLDDDDATTLDLF